MDKCRSTEIIANRADAKIGRPDVLMRQEGHTLFIQVKDVIRVEDNEDEKKTWSISSSVRLYAPSVDVDKHNRMFRWWPRLENRFGVRTLSLQKPVLPGSRIIQICGSIFAKTTVDRVLMPIISDMQIDCRYAEDEGQCVRALTTRICGYLNFALAIIKHVGIVAAKKTGLAWNGQSVSSERNNEK